MGVSVVTPSTGVTGYLRDTGFYKPISVRPHVVRQPRPKGQGLPLIVKSGIELALKLSTTQQVMQLTKYKRPMPSELWKDTVLIGEAGRYEAQKPLYIVPQVLTMFIY